MISSSLLMFHSRTGAITCSEGFIALTVTSILTWSFPLPVHPWATASAPSFSATSTSFFPMSGLPRAVLRG